MFHLIEFRKSRWLDVERSPRLPLERLLLRAGTRTPVQLRPHVVQGIGGIVEAADLFFEDGTIARDVPFADFRFVE